LKKLFKARLNQIINCLSNLDATKVQKSQKKVIKNSNYVTSANQVDISFLRQFINNLTNNRLAQFIKKLIDKFKNNIYKIQMQQIASNI